MIDITNIEYNFSAFLTSLSLLTGYEFNADTFKPKSQNAAYCIEVDGSQTFGDQGRSVETIRATIKIRDDADYLAKEAALSVYTKKEVFGFDKTLPLYTDGAGFTVTAKDTSMIKATNAPIFLQTDDNGRFVYIMSVEITISSN